VEEGGLTAWSQAVAVLEQEHSYLLDPQLADDLAAIRVAFERASLK